jgi:long-chain fatty acid transport protein
MTLLPAPAFAAGFQILEHGTAATGMVGAFTGKADDVSAIFFNPAGLADQTGLQVYVGGMLITGAPSAEMVPGGGAVGAQVEPQPLPTIYTSYHLPHDVTVGAGLFSQFGLSVEWPSDWAGRFLVTQAQLRTVTINPTASWRPKPWFAVGGGLDFTPASVKLERSLDLVAAEGTARFAANTVGVGANLGVMFDPIPEVSLGISYRSQYNLNFHSGALQLDVPPELSQQLPDMPASTTLPMPDLLSFGATVRPTDDVSIIAQVDWTNWSRFQNLTLTTPVQAMDMSIPEKWHDGWTMRLGAEWIYSETDKLRFGFGYDWNPVPASTMGPIIPDADRVLLSFGASHDFGNNLTGELALMGVFFQDRTSELAGFNARYLNTALLTSLSVEYRSGSNVRR